MSLNPNFVNQCKQFVRRNAVNKNILVTYLRDNKNTPYGVVVAVRQPDDVVVYGTAFCHSKKDRFNKYVGTYIAAQRALAHKEPVVPEYNGHDETLKGLSLMQNRASKYWQDSLVLV